MEGIGIENNDPPQTVLENPDVESSKSAENFQKFIYELFEKNGVINDLRAYLRFNIVGVLRGAQTGNPPPCQKHFTQRLDLPFQALNILIAEYLLRLEFSYTLSVFVSEIPLANMVFAFSKALMQGTNNCDSSLRFKKEDVWLILNYLGVKCDSKHAFNIVNMYRAETESPLLLCILKCIPMYEELHVDASQDSLSSSGKCASSQVKDKAHNSPPEKCRHCVFCTTCQRSMISVKEKFRKKRKILAENIKESSAKNMESVMTNIEVMETSLINENIKESSAKNMESVMTNIEVMETSLINEMFQQLKSVYESEMAMMKDDEEKRYKRSLAHSALQLQKKRVEMEEKFKAREAELERNVQQKKRFLWGLARDLRDQHQNMSRAMHDVRAETARLAAKELRLRSQLAEAGRALRRRGAAARAQRQLAHVKDERDSIDKERDELEHIKHLCDNTKTTNTDSTKEDLRKHYDLLTNELSILKKCLVTAKLEPKCVVDRGTATQLADLTCKIDVVLNNGHEVERNRSEDKLKAEQVVNDLKKRTNVNFCEAKMNELYRSRSRSMHSHSSHSHSSGSSEAGDAQCDTEQRALQRLRDENERLRTFARQQSEHIEELCRQQARLRARLAALRPRTAPALAPNANLFTRLNSSGSGNNPPSGWRSGAGEELSLFRGAPPAPAPPAPAPPAPAPRAPAPPAPAPRAPAPPAPAPRAPAPPAPAPPAPAPRAPAPPAPAPRAPAPPAPAPRAPAPPAPAPPGGACERRADHRRYLMHQGRSLRRRASPVEAAERRTAPGSRDGNEDRAYCTERSVRIASEEDTNCNGNREPMGNQRHESPRELNEQFKITAEERVKKREKNTRIMKGLHKLISPTQDENHSSVICDAKLRLRKLEIEAEAVEKSYLDFKRKREKMRREENAAENDDVGISAGKESENNKADELHTMESICNKERTPTKTDFDRYISEYRAKYDIGKTHFMNNNAACCQAKPVPSAFSPYESSRAKDKKPQNYLETPMAEFRKYYQTEKRDKSKLENNKNLENDHSTTLTKTQDYYSSRERVRSPTFININGWEPPQNTATKNPDDSVNKKSTTPSIINLEMIEERIGDKSPITKSWNDSTSSNKPKSAIHSGAVEDRDDPESNRSQAPVNSGPVESRNVAKSPLNRNQDDCGSMKSPRSLGAYSEETEGLELAIKKTRDFPDSSKKSTKLTSSTHVKIRSRSQSLTSESVQSDGENRSEGDKTKVFRRAKHEKAEHDKAQELQILKQNIGKIHNLSEKSADVTWKENNERKTTKELSRSETSGEPKSNEHMNDKNLLRIELQSVSEVKDVKITDSVTQDVLLVVESPADNDIHRDINFSAMSTQMTILVSPKRSGVKEPDTKSESSINSDSGEKAIKSGPDVFDTVYKTDQHRHSARDVEANIDPDYLDDFSVDVDNFNSSRYDSDDIRSPISLLKTSEDDNFWDP